MADDLYGLSALPKPKVIEELSFEQILAEIKAETISDFPGLAGYIDLLTEPSAQQAIVYANREMRLRARVNDAARANLLFFATGSDLDHLAAFYDVTRLAGELDDRLKRRVVLAMQGRSTGGTAPRYKLIALSASLRVKDAIVYRVGTNPTVNIAVFAADNGGVADADLIALVQAAVTADDKRMVSDRFVFRSAIFQTVNVEANVWLLPESPDTLIPLLASTLGVAWTVESGLGFDFVRPWAVARLMQSGVQKVELITPSSDVIAPPESAISLGTVTLHNMGRAY
ncbi:baseplate J/gp47 family protein [Terrarubrum flagellatum]|uniref:baseplate J/gp47 family protein n=1 Tax=Terrirubrum flagellatum TaxID=2895980 RepID=UPI003144E0B7